MGFKHKFLISLIAFTFLTSVTVTGYDDDEDYKGRLNHAIKGRAHPPPPPPPVPMSPPPPPSPPPGPVMCPIHPVALETEAM
ncbi:unnamed protein product [Orchesella dallaii]|uniref:Uncharacterized protein n=1 Tax=Orchesella dallaii TaxID=48710 RepID=A0ABP1RQN8_9HEXA